MLALQSHVPQNLNLVQVPALSIFETSLRRGKFDSNRKLSNGGMLEFAKIYPMDAVFDTPDDVPEDVRPVCRQCATCHYTPAGPHCNRHLPCICSSHIAAHICARDVGLHAITPQGAALSSDDGASLHHTHAVTMSRLPSYAFHLSCR